ncbi:uncharacterized protein GGS22DRAFT_167700 [Annulohypoxylon maeteangense]|uniref:uncharacterized protein n=1 Tax=Annulohypoxylon maeteangense TaxID=1927788 RepID=UPI0020087E15|nr:uncharacterized protein GGS22DRAFT_167700 [Annulohypoxylon maeteangense]KAI0883028.1 hypothetical protein GGS22DRAFT_167700 [Annulohypoxylon maeteangense]
MFASWKPVSDSDGQNVLLCKRPHTFDPVTAKTERPVACSQCRVQKVRCTGEQHGEGCSRCQAQRRKCTYPRRRSSAAQPTEEAPNFADTELRSDPLELPTPAPTEDSGRPVSSASVSRAAQELIREPQGGYSNGMDFSHFPLNQEFTRYSSFAVMGECQVRNGIQGGHSATEQMATQEHTHSHSHSNSYSNSYSNSQSHPQSHPQSHTQSHSHLHSLFRSSQNPEMYPGPNEPVANCSPRSQSRLPQAQALFSGETQNQAGANTLRPSGPDCQCLHRVVILIDELEVFGEPSRSHLPLDGILVAHRKALRQAEDMIACASCATRVDHMIILTFLVSRLANICCRAISALSSPSSHRATGASLSTASRPGVNEALITSVGAYRIDSETEHVAVVRVLLHIGLDRLLGLVSALQEVGRRLGSDTMDRRLGVCRRAIGIMLDGR